MGIQGSGAISRLQSIPWVVAVNETISDPKELSPSFVLCHNYKLVMRVWLLRVFGHQLFIVFYQHIGNALETNDYAREARKEPWPEDSRVICFSLIFISLLGGGRTQDNGFGS